MTGSLPELITQRQDSIVQTAHACTKDIISEVVKKGHEIGNTAFYIDYKHKGKIGERHEVNENYLPTHNYNLITEKNILQGQTRKKNHTSMKLIFKHNGEKLDEK